MMLMATGKGRSGKHRLTVMLSQPVLHARCFMLGTASPVNVVTR